MLPKPCSKRLGSYYPCPLSFYDFFFFFEKIEVLNVSFLTSRYSHTFSFNGVWRNTLKRFGLSDHLAE